MDFDLIRQYAHKVKKIHITNTNRYSLRNYIVLKIHMDTKDTETVRFSLKENSEYIGHQQKDSDFFIRVPNNLMGFDDKPTVTTIYAHFFDKTLYQYEEHQQIFSEFDFSKLPELAEEITSSNYQLTTDSEKKTATLRSLLPNSIDQYKNPNYKQYTQSNVNDNIIQGHLPRMSAYSPDPKFYKAPYLLNQGSNAWTKINNYNTNWTAKIHRDVLSPLISDGVENTEEDMPINIFLNYNYLPTSAEHHMHRFGFEDKQHNEYYNILEGENLDIINDKFGNHNNYRIIHSTNIFNDKYSMFVPKSNIIDIDLSTAITHYCQLQYNQCYKYYTYRPTDTPNYASKIIELKKGKIYTLKYYVYIPDTMLDTEDVYIGVNDEKILPTFMQQDKLLKEQWIYHEVPFISKGTDVIYIQGPMNVVDDNICHFINVSIEEMVEYSPTIKYNQKGILLYESNSAVSRPINNNIDNTPIGTNTASKNWTPTELPIIQKRVYFILNRNKNVSYNSINKTLYYTHDTEEDFFIRYENNGDLIITEDDEINFYMDDDYNIIVEYDTNMIFTKSIGNDFNVWLKDINGNDVNSGIVEAAIHDDKMTEKDDLTTALKYLGQRNVTHGTIEFDNIDLSNLPLVNNQDTIYYLHLKYSNPCNDISFIYEPIILQNQQYTLTAMSRNNNINLNQTFTISKNKQLPLQIQCQVTNQLNKSVTSGYVDLSIDDHETQSTIVDSNGIADFYLDLDDLKYGTQTLKLEYFTKNYHPVKYIYYKVNNHIENKPTLPFIVKGIIQENKQLPIDMSEYVHELQTITDTQVYDLGFSPVFMNIDIDIPSGQLNDVLILKIYRNDTLIYTYTLNYIPTESLIFVDDFDDLHDDEVQYHSKTVSPQTATYKVALMSNNDYRYNDVDINITHY